LRVKPWLLFLPSLAIVLFNAFIPICTVISYSLHNYFPSVPPEFLGLEQYRRLLSDPDFLGSLGRGLLFSLECMVIEIPLGLGIALALPKKGVFGGVSLALIAVPLVIPWMTVGLMWRLLTQQVVGPIPFFFEKLGMEFNMSTPIQAFQTVVLMDVWHWTPLVILLMSAGLSALPEEYYEAAKIDGARSWRIFRFVTLPGLKSPLLVLLLLRFIDTFKIYDEVWVLTSGGPADTTTFLSIFTVRLGIGAFNLGYGSAVSLTFLYVVLTVCFVLMVIMTKGRGLNE
jgi:glycerol transport system permease protein